MTVFPNLGFAGNSLPRREEGHFVPERRLEWLGPFP